MSDRTLLRDTLAALAAAGHLDKAGWRRGRALAGLAPDAARWRRFVDRLMLAVGALLIAVGIVFFVAFNWQALARGEKFLLVEALLGAAVVAAWRLRLDTPAGRAAMGAAIGILGALLALFGQTYQTGADTHELFLTWAALALPWAIAARSGPVAALWWTVLNLGVFLALSQRWLPAFGFGGLLFASWGNDVALQGSVLLNAVAAASAEAWAKRGGGTVFARTAVLYVLATAALLALDAIFGHGERWAAAVLYLGSAGAGLYAYRRWRRDLALLAAIALSLVVVSVALVARLLHEVMRHSDSGVLFLLAAYTVAATGAAAWWLNRVRREAP